MAVVKTKRNYVCAYEVVPGDAFVATYMAGRLLLMQGISEYRPALEWALTIADKMEHPLEIVPLTAAEYVDLDHSQNKRKGGLSEQQREALRVEAINMLAKVLRDCDDPAIRADAHGILVRMGVVQ